MAGFAKAKSEPSKFKCSIYGAPGSGKTLTTLLLLEGLAKAAGKRVAYIDTEMSSRHYRGAVKERRIHPEAFDFDVLDTKSLTEALRLIEDEVLGKDTYAAVGIDTASDLWDSAKDAYECTLMNGEQIPIHAWGKVRKPLRDLVWPLLQSDLHFIQVGREANDFMDDPESGQLMNLGKKMEGEKKTTYEPDFLFRMAPRKNKDGSFEYNLIAEKDRIGLLGGRTIANPSYENIIVPMLPYLSMGNGQHTAMPEPESRTAKDAMALADLEAAKAKISAEMRRDYEARFMLAKTVKDLDAVSKELTPTLKKLMTTGDLTATREAYRERLEVIQH